MITRGHFIGEIVDELSSVANQIASRSKLGLLDLNVFSEPRRPPKVLHLWPPKLLHPGRGDLTH
jgi:hypothetical protein